MSPMLREMSFSARFRATAEVYPPHPGLQGRENGDRSTSAQVEDSRSSSALPHLPLHRIPICHPSSLHAIPRLPCCTSFPSASSDRNREGLRPLPETGVRIPSSESEDSQLCKPDFLPWPSPASSLSEALPPPSHRTPLPRPRLPIKIRLVRPLRDQAAVACAWILITSSPASLRSST